MMLILNAALTGFNAYQFAKTGSPFSLGLAVFCGIMTLAQV